MPTRLPYRVMLALCACATNVGLGCGSNDENDQADTASQGRAGSGAGGTSSTDTGGAPQAGGSNAGGSPSMGGAMAGGNGGKNAGGSGPGSGGTPGTGGAASTGGTVGTSSGEPNALKGITELHNQARRKVGVPDLVWDPALATIAQAWASKCIDEEAPTGLIDHNASRGVGYPASVGENIFGSSGAPTPEQAVSSWVSEAKNYNYAANTCAGVCGHYTQVVWKTTQKVGCAIYQCPGLKFGGTLVCDYSPAGNVNGQRPY